MNKQNSVSIMVTIQLAQNIFSFVAIIAGFAHGLLEEDVDGALGPGREFSLDNVGGVVFVEGVDESGDCCEVCQAKDKDTQMFNFHLEDKQCSCLKTDPPHRPTTNEATVFSGFCHENSVPDIDINRGRRESHYQYRYRKSVGTPGVDKLIKQDSVLVQGGVDGVQNSSLCCQECRNRFTDTEIFQFDNFYYNYCHCFKIIPGTKPVTEALEHTADICHTAEEREALALTVVSRGCKELLHGIPCCPRLAKGDNTLGTEVFVQEDEIMSSCIETCQTLHPLSVGMTESTSETYGNGAPKCWCEFGEPSLNRNEDYQTCIFKP